jgi:cellulose synthase/poly-beta-1,6-N-acetylglucosamine synthase-like glycosyltransferase
MRRPRPFSGTRDSVLVGALSLLAVAIAAAYFLTPTLGDCGGCAPRPALGLAYDALSVATVLIACYFLALYVVGLRNAAQAPKLGRGRSPFFVMITPAHDEALVIEATVKRLRALDAEPDRFLALIVNDGSSDATSDIARAAAEGDERIIVLDRVEEIAGQGKGEVLNHAYHVVSKLEEWGDSRLHGAGADEIVVCVVDADGWLRQDALRRVAPYFEHPYVGAVQIPVRMYNARSGFLAAMQDIEFIAFSILIQGGRDRIGSALLGGNGQFVRLSALRSIGRRPWTKSLTEDLDLGLRLAREGWRIRMCPHTTVSQQAVTSPRRLLRQRTRWVQGHYTCWSHLPALWSAPRVPLATRVDLSIHLLLATVILLVTGQALLGALGFAGVFPVEHSVLADLVGNDVIFRAVVLLASAGPLALVALAYQRTAVAFAGTDEERLPVWALPGMFLAFAAYMYFWGLPSSARAFKRMTVREDGWAKTARDPVAGFLDTPEVVPA